MALIECLDCGAQLSSSAETCPTCNARSKGTEEERIEEHEKIKGKRKIEAEIRKDKIVSATLPTAFGLWLYYHSFQHHGSHDLESAIWIAAFCFGVWFFFWRF